MFEPVADDHVSTRYAAAPHVTVRGADGITSVEMSFDASLILEDGTIWVTDLEFHGVIDFRFGDFDLGLDPVQPEDFAYHLIRIVDSTMIADLAGRALTRPAAPVLGPGDLSHFRIGFDDHGIYDITCLGINISTRKATTPIQE